MGFIRKGSSDRRLPVVIAAEMAECGLACLAMVGRYHGHDIDLQSLRSRFTLSMSGLSLRSVIAIAGHLHLSARAVRTEPEYLSKVRTPAILHWDLAHYVVLRSANARRIVIHDPNYGLKTLNLNEVSRHFTGVALELTPQADFRIERGRTQIRLDSLWTRSHGLWGAAGQILLLSACLQAAAFAAPFYIQLVTDAAISRGDTSLLTTLALAFAAIALLQAGLTALRDWVVQIFGNMLSYQLIGNLIRHLLHLPASFFEKRNIGDILSRVNSTSTIQETMTRGVLSVLIDGIMAVIAIVIMTLYSYVLACIVVGSVVVNTVLTLALYPRTRALNEEQLNASACERSHIMESVRAFSTIKLVGREAEREGAWRNLYAKVINANTKLATTKVALDAVQLGITSISGIAVIYIAAGYVLQGGLFTVGMLFAFISFRQTFTDRTTSLLTQVTQFRLLGLHLERIGDIVAVEAEPSGLPVGPLRMEGRISMTGVSYRYGDADPWVIKDLDLTIAPGEYVAIVGPSGGGKTTLLKLMLGLLYPNKGQILLEGRSATSGLFRQWRSEVGVVAQDDRLLSGSIGDNIAFFDPGADPARIKEAAASAQIHDDIARMPLGYASLVGDMGSSLSEGQKQRVLLARALYRRPKVLILDEGTANLDLRTEELIADVIDGLPITRIVVAHRPALVERAGRIVTIGAHANLAVATTGPKRFADTVAAERTHEGRGRAGRRF